MIWLIVTLSALAGVAIGATAARFALEPIPIYMPSPDSDCRELLEELHNREEPQSGEIVPTGDSL